MNTTHTHTPSLQTRNLVKNFGHVAALRGISLNIASGQSVAIMGPSGSGKSTLLHCLSGVLPPTSGHVWLNGKDISEASDKTRSKLRLNTCGFVFQDGQLVPELSARENVAIPLLLQGKKRTEAFTIADQWLDRLGIFEQKDRRPGDMSGGQMQRIAIARALAPEPEVVFADEPTGALDQSTGHEVIQILSMATQMRGATLVMVTHDPKVAQWCERIIEIRDGVIHADTYEKDQ